MSATTNGPDEWWKADPTPSPSAAPHKLDAIDVLRISALAAFVIVMIVEAYRQERLDNP